MKICTFLLVLAVFFHAYANAEEPGSALQGLVGKWLEKEPLSYKYHLKAGGIFGYSNFKISVKDGRCMAKSQYVFGKDKTRWKKDSCEGRTIKELIKSVEVQEQEGVVQSDIKLNHECRFVSYYLAEPKTDLADQGWYFEITNFRVQ